MKKVTVKISGETQTYPIVIGPGLVSRVGELARPLKAKHAFVIADRALKTQQAKLTRGLRAAGWRVDATTIVANEAAKEYRQAFELYTQLVKCGADRGSVIFALGGGVIGDLAGFVAATYWRGMRWVGVPTTLLAQVDSSIGGKTGVNHPLGKNLIGSLHQPSLVVCDTSLLKTLSLRDRASGLGEAVKYGLIFDRAFFQFIVANLDKALELKPAIIDRVVADSAKWKAHVVGRDARETRGLRFHLNFGHTLGHAIEAATDYKQFRHGEAVVWGMRGAVALSVVRGHLARELGNEIDQALALIPVPPLPENLSLTKLLPYLQRDKKAENGKIAFVLLKKIGEAVLDRGVTRNDLELAWG